MAKKGNIGSSESGNWEVMEPEPTYPKRLRLALASVNDIRREMARVYREMRVGSIDPAVGTKLTYVLAQLRTTLEVGDLETRLQALEQVAERFKD